MRPRHLLFLLIAAVWAVVAVVLGTGALSSAKTALTPSGASPRCLPSTLQHSSAIAGTNVNVSPEPGSVSASPDTQISFQGAPVTDINDVSVRGSRSGDHGGRLEGYYQGDGGSFVPYRSFESDEKVTVRAIVGPPRTGHRVYFTFHTTTAYPTAGIPGFPHPTAVAADTQGFHSAPSVHPPLVAVSAPDHDPGAGDVFLTPATGPGQYGPMIFDGTGGLVWFDPLSGNTDAENLQVQRYEGQDDLTWWRGNVLAIGFGQGENVVMNRNYQTVAVVKAGNGYTADLHEFQIEPGEIAYVTAYPLIRCDLTSVGGVKNGAIVDPVIQAIDIKTGLVRWEWSSLDHVGVGESHAPVPTKAMPWDAFHLNSVDEQRNGDLLVSLRSTWATYELQKGSGAIRWRLGGTRSSFAMGPGTATAWQHDAREQPDGTITLFDDGSTPRVHFQSRAIRVRLDLQARTATLVKSDVHPTPIVSDSQGNTQVLPDRNVFVAFGAIPYFTEFSPSGAVLLDGHLPPGHGFYRAFRAPWSGRPLTQPSVAATVIGGDNTAVYASWNGATEVARWTVLAGSDSSSLTPVATVARTGFETTTIVAQAYGRVAVQALDSAGRILSTSPTISVATPAASPAG